MGYKILLVLIAMLWPLICAAQEIDGDQLKDATVTSDKLAIDVTDDIADGVTAYGWGNHADGGYLTSLLHSHSNYITSLEHAHSGYATTEHSHSGYLTSLDHSHSNYLTSLLHNHDNNYEGSGAVTTHENTYDHTLIATALQPDDNVSELTNDAGYLTSLAHNHSLDYSAIGHAHSEYLTSLEHAHSSYALTSHEHSAYLTSLAHAHAQYAEITHDHAATYIDAAGDTMTGNIDFGGQVSIGTTTPMAANQLVAALGSYTAAANSISLQPFDLRFYTTAGAYSSNTVREMYIRHLISGKTDTTNAGIYEALFTQANLTANNAAGIRGVDFGATNSGTGVAATAHGLIGVVTNSSSGSITNAYAAYPYISNSGSGSITNAYNIYLQSANISAGSITNQYGLFIDNITGASAANYSIYTGSAANYFGGATTIAGAATLNGNLTIGDSSGDSLTINASTASVPNNLNFDSNTLYIDAASNRVGVGVAPSYTFQVYGSSTDSINEYVSRYMTGTAASTYANSRNLAYVNTPGSTTAGYYVTLFNTLETAATDTGDHTSGYLSAQLNEMTIRGSGDIAYSRGIQNSVWVVPTATGVWSNVYGSYNGINIASTDSAGSSVGNIFGNYISIVDAAVPVTAAYGEYISGPTTTTSSVTTYTGYYNGAPSTTTTNAYAFYSTAAGANVTNDWGVYVLNDLNYFAGKVGIGTTAPSSKLTVAGTFNATQVLIDNGSTTVTVDTAWNEIGATGKPAFENGWINFNNDTTFNTAAYRIDALGYVHLKGSVEGGTIGNSSNRMFTLPAGYRPEKKNAFAVESNDAHGSLRIGPEGYVWCPAGNNARVSLDGITFKAYQ